LAFPQILCLMTTSSLLFPPPPLPFSNYPRGLGRRRPASRRHFAFSFTLVCDAPSIAAKEPCSFVGRLFQLLKETYFHPSDPPSRLSPSPPFYPNATGHLSYFKPLGPHHYPLPPPPTNPLHHFINSSFRNFSNPTLSFPPPEDPVCSFPKVTIYEHDTLKHPPPLVGKSDFWPSRFLSVGHSSCKSLESGQYFVPLRSLLNPSMFLTFVPAADGGADVKVSSFPTFYPTHLF